MLVANRDYAFRVGRKAGDNFVIPHSVIVDQDKNYQFLWRVYRITPAKERYKKLDIELEAIFPALISLRT